MFDPITGALVSAGVQYGLGKLFGGKSGSAQAPLSNYQSPGFSAGGLKASADASGTYTVTPSKGRMGYVTGVADQYGAQADELAALRARVAPGISELRASRLSEIENARQSAIGNLRENLQRRRVLGSSFGNDALARAEAEFGKERERVASESFLQEIGLTSDFVAQEYNARRSVFQTGLDELNLQADIATKLTTGAATQLGANARTLAQLNAAEQAGTGKFLGQTFAPVGSAIARNLTGGADPSGWTNGIPQGVGLGGYGGSF
jgi:hypothetical protein